MSETMAAKAAPPDANEHDAGHVRNALLQGFAPEGHIAAALGVSMRTVQRLDLPFVRIGIRRYYDLAKSREKLLRADVSDANSTPGTKAA